VRNGRDTCCGSRRSRRVRQRPSYTKSVPDVVVRAGSPTPRHNSPSRRWRCSRARSNSPAYLTFSKLSQRARGGDETARPPRPAPPARPSDACRILERDVPGIDKEAALAARCLAYRHWTLGCAPLGPLVPQSDISLNSQHGEGGGGVGGRGRCGAGWKSGGGGADYVGGVLQVRGDGGGFFVRCILFGIWALDGPREHVIAGTNGSGGTQVQTIGGNGSERGFFVYAGKRHAREPDDRGRRRGGSGRRAVRRLRRRGQLGECEISRVRSRSLQRHRRVGNCDGGRRPRAPPRRAPIWCRMGADVPCASGGCRSTYTTVTRC